MAAAKPKNAQEALLQKIKWQKKASSTRSRRVGNGNDRRDTALSGLCVKEGCSAATTGSGHHRAIFCPMFSPGMNTRVAVFIVTSPAKRAVTAPPFIPIIHREDGHDGARGKPPSRTFFLDRSWFFTCSYANSCWRRHHYGAVAMSSK